MRTVRWMGAWCAIVTVSAIGMVAQMAFQPETELRAAQYRERIQGDVTGAISEYQRLSLSTDRTVASTALLALSEAYARIGRTDSTDVLVRISREFPESSAAGVARRRLELRSGGPTARLLISGTAANEVWGAVSSDGRFLTFQHPETGNVAVRDLNSGQTRLVTNSKGYEEGFTETAIWSPDGGQLAYSWWLNENNRSVMQLRVTARDKGTPNILFKHERLEWMKPLAWSPDGKSILAYLDMGGDTQLGLIAVAGGSLKVLTTATGLSAAAFSPDGRYIVYDHTPSKTVPMRDINVISADGKNDHAVVASPDDDFLLGWHPDGRHVLFGSDRLGTPGAWAIAISGGVAQGSPTLVKADIGRTSSLGFDRQGRLFTSLSVAGNDVFIAEVEATSGKMTQQTRPVAKGQPLARRSQAMWSRDGRQLVYVQALQGHGDSLVVQTVATGELSMRPVELRNIFRPTWFPDGSAVAVLAHDIDGHRGIFKIDLRTGGVTTLLLPSQTFSTLTPDGDAIIYTRDQSLVRRRIADGTEQEILKGRAGNAVLSPDGRTIARFVGSSIAVAPATTAASEQMIVKDIPGGNKRLAWSHDSRFVFYVSGEGEIWRVPSQGGAAIDTGIRSPLPNLLSVNPDGRRIAISGGEAQAEVWIWENLLR